MAESYSVKAVLSAQDDNFTKIFQNAADLVSRMNERLGDGSAFTTCLTAGQRAADAVTAGLSRMDAALTQSAAVWGTWGAQACAQLDGAAQRAVIAGAGLGVLSLGLASVGAGAVFAGAGLGALSLGLASVGAGAVFAGAGLGALSLGLASVGAGAAVVSGTALALAASLGAGALAAGTFGGALMLCAAGSWMLAAALGSVNGSVLSIGQNAAAAGRSLAAMQGAVSTVQAGLSALGNMAKSAMDALARAFDNGAGRAKSAGQQIGTNLHSGVRAGLEPLPLLAAQSMARFDSAVRAGGSRAVSSARITAAGVVSALRSARGGAYSAGVNIGAGLANGMASQLGRVRSIAAQLAAAAAAAIRAKAQIHSPSRVTARLGAYFGEGFAEGIAASFREVQRAGEQLTALPSRGAEHLKMPDAGEELSAAYSYHADTACTIVVPVEIDGREAARATAKYTREELEKLTRRENRRKGTV